MNDFRFGKHKVLMWRPEGKPTYSMDWLMTQPHLKDDDFIFFYGHGRASDGAISETCLSQMYTAHFRDDEKVYFCMEQYMMAEKARLFGDREYERKIMRSRNPVEIKRMGRMVRDFDGTVWDLAKHSVVLNGNFSKFAKNKPLLRYLVSTGSKILVEASPHDAVWGIKMKKDSQGVTNPVKWQGQNMLGFALMEVRDTFQEICDDLPSFLNG